MFCRMMMALFAAGVLAGFSAGCGANYRNDAEKQFLKAAKKGDAEAQYRLGASYEFGAGAPVDIELAKSWYQKAVAQGHQKAIARMRVLAPPAAPSAEEAKSLRAAARRSGADGETLYRWAECCEFGYHTTRDRDAALRFYLRAEQKGYAAAGERVRALSDEMMPDDATVKRYHAAAKKGDAEAQYQFARCLEFGFRRKRNPAVARQWYESAARKGHSKARARLGWRTPRPNASRTARPARNGPGR